MSMTNIESMKQNGCELWWTGNVASANAPKQITANGNVTQLLPFPGAGIGVFDTSSDYLIISDWYSSGCALFLNSDFTIEYFWMVDDISVSKGIFSQSTDGSNYANFGWLSSDYSSLRMYIVVSGTTVLRKQAYFTPVVGQRYHIVFQRQGSTYSIFVNGVSLSIFNSIQLGHTVNFTGNLLLFTSFTGNASEFRISTVARYTSNFIPPRHQLESDENTVLLLHFKDNSTTFIDSSPNNHTITAYGDAKQLCSPCGSGVAYFDGNGDYLTIPATSLSFGNHWTIECFVKFNVTNVRQSIFVQTDSSGSAASTSIMFEFYPPHVIYISFQSSSGWNTAQFSSFNIDVSHVYYIQGIRDGNALYLYIDEELKATIDVTNKNININNTDPWTIGQCGSYNGGLFNGNILEFRISNVARPVKIPTQPFKPDPYTKLLLHMDGVGNAFYDSSDPPGDNGFPILPDGVTVTPNGTFVVEKMKDGRNIWKFDGSTNYIAIQQTPVLDIVDSNFSICFWIRLGNNTVTNVFGKRSSENTRWHVNIDYINNRIGLYSVISGIANAHYTVESINFSKFAWYHIAVIRFGNLCLIYINGIDKTVTIITAFQNSNVIVGEFWINRGGDGTYYGNNNVKDLMIFKGKALTQDQIAAIMAETYIY